MKRLSGLMVLVLLLAVLAPSFAAGPVYDELPDLEGAEIIVAVENFYTPYQFEDPRAEGAIGFEYDVVNEVCRRINCTPVYETTTFEAQLAGVQAGEYDMAMNGLFITEERQAIYDFSIPYIFAESYLLARANETRFTDFANFAAIAADQDLIIGVQNNSFGQFLAGPNGPEQYRTPESQIVTFEGFGELLVALQNGDIDTMVVDAFGGKFVSTNADAFKLVGPPVVEPAPVGFIFQKGSEFVEPFNAAIDSMFKDGYMDYLLYKWSTDFQPLAE
jgi:polar amino acid transport system substrate-binding protein